ncbi:MAG: O-antigen polysaccharide polymerase Wzy [Clostridia bacterium]|nr:O-antigen polysaccharide polymerase Wzy [Clostridia bacterium]
MLKDMTIFGFKKLQLTILTIIVTFIVGLVGVLMMNGSIGGDVSSNVVSFSRIGVFCLVFSVAVWFVLRREMICPYIMYLVCAWGFMFGQCLFWAFGSVTLHKNLYNRYDDATMLPAMVFTVLCLMAMHLGAMLSAKDLSVNRFNQGTLKRRMTTEEAMRAIKISAWILFAISVLPFIYTSAKNISLVLSSNYKQLYLEESNSRFDEILEVLRSFLIPSMVLLLVAYPKSRFISFMFIIFSAVIILTKSVIGGRGGSFMMVITFICAWHFIKKPLNWARILAIVLVVYILLVGSTILGAVRNTRNKTVETYTSAYEIVSEKENPAVSAIGEIGWQLSSTVEVMKHVPSDYEFRNGKTYFYSMTTIIPNLGFWDVHPAVKNAQLTKWLQAVMNLNYGPGFSIVAEAYINFGWFGILFMIIEGLIFGRILTSSDRYSIKYNPEMLSINLTFLVVSTLSATRSSALVFVRSVLYNVVPVYLLILIVNYSIKYSSRKAEIKSTGADKIKSRLTGAKQ